MKNFSPGLKIFRPVLFWFYTVGTFFGCLKKKYKMFAIYVWTMYQFSDVNSSVKCNNYCVWVISSYICLKKKWIQRQKFLKRRHLVRKPRSVWVARGSTGELWNNVKKKISHTSGGKEIFGCRKTFFEILDEVKPLLN